MPTARSNGHRGTRDSDDDLHATAPRIALPIERGLAVARGLPRDDAS
jgi:hypothetical protein